MSIYEFKSKKCRWIFIEGVSGKTADYLKNNFKFHSLDIDDVTSEHQRPKIDIYKYYIFLISAFPYYDKARKKMRVREVDIFIDNDTLIMISNKQYPFLKNLFKRVSESAKLKKMWMDKSPSFLFYKVVEKLYRDSHCVFDIIGKQIRNVEDAVYDSELKSVAHDLAMIRRSTFSLRRVIDPQRFTMNMLINIKSTFIPEYMKDYFDNLNDYLNKMWAEIENFKDNIDSLHSTNESLISQHTNKIINILTIISASLLPLTLLSGIYGMNISGLPLVNSPIMVLGLFAAVALFTIFMVFILVRSKKIN